MAIKYYGTGNWGLPEFNLTETLFGGNPQSTANAINKTLRGTASPEYGPAIPQNFYESNTSSGGTSGGSGGSSGSGSTSGNTGGSNRDDGQSEAYRRAQEELARRLNEMRGMLGERSALSSAYEQMMGEIPTQQQSDENSYLQQMMGLRTGVNTAKDNTMQKIQGYRNDVDSRTKKSIGDLSEDIRNSIRGVLMQIGAMGGGDSSASQVMTPYAFSKLGARERGNLYQQRNEQYGQLDQKALDVEAVASQQLANIDQEEIQGLSQIKNQYQARLNQLREAKAYADDDMKAKIENFEYETLRQAQAEMQNYRSQYDQMRTGIQEWVMSVASQAPAMQNAIAGTGNYSVQDVMRNVMPKAAQMGTQMADDFYSNYNPLAYLGYRKKREE